MYIIVGVVVGIILGLIAMYMLKKPKIPVSNTPVQQMENQQTNTSDQVQSNNTFNNQPRQP
jgi:uncharacterized membrane-anchored protein YhcB (DUF1043 family)